MKTSYKEGKDSDRCCITLRLFKKKNIRHTRVGPIADVLWGNEPFVCLKDGSTQIPKHLIPLYEASFAEKFDDSGNNDVASVVTEWCMHHGNTGYYDTTAGLVCRDCFEHQPRI